MANVFIDENVLISVADAIRAKTGSTDKIYPKDFSATIENISGSSEDVRYVTFMNGDAVLYVKPVAVGDDCVDVLAKGLIETPTKESTAQYNYAYSGWSLTDGGSADTANALANVTEDRTVYAAYTESVRYYTVSFYDGETLLNSEQVAYGGSSTYSYKKDNHIFNGWSPEPTNVTSNISCYGSWEESYSFADASWEYIAQMSESGRASEVFAIGDTKTIEITAINGSKINSDVQIVGFNHDDLADGSGKAGISIIFVNALHYNIFSDDGMDMYHSKGSYFDTGGARDFINDTVYLSFSEDLRNHIKTVTKTTSISWSSTDKAFQYTTSDDKIWYPSPKEITNVTKRGAMPDDGVLYEYFTVSDNRKKYFQRIDGIADTYYSEQASTEDDYGTRSVVLYNGQMHVGSILCSSGMMDYGPYHAWAIGFCI